MAKQGTPSMGGVLIIIGHRSSRPSSGATSATLYVWLAIVSMVAVRRDRAPRRRS
ncbi:MAG: hypothetical protein MZU95_04840 [Desulfomicrobium escambiense]|nr:hypothetical protein [Desulfomicrobium escambiense]